MNTNAAAEWCFDKRDLIRLQAGHDAAKFEALVLDPALAREARELFPDDPTLYGQLCAILESEILLARGGIFLIDGPPTDEQLTELRRRNRETLAKWRASR